MPVYKIELQFGRKGEGKGEGEGKGGGRKKRKKRKAERCKYQTFVPIFFFKNFFLFSLCPVTLIVSVASISAPCCYTLMITISKATGAWNN